MLAGARHIFLYRASKISDITTDEFNLEAISLSVELLISVCSLLLYKLEITKEYNYFNLMILI